MKKFVCDLCGYIYDEAAGAPDEGIKRVGQGLAPPQTGNNKKEG